MCEIALTRGYRAIVDADLFEEINKYKWHAVPRKKNGILYAVYAERKENKKNIMMHRQILSVTDSKTIVDHVDGNGLNNTRKNLRVCTHQENMRNSRKKTKSKAGFRGVREFNNCKIKRFNAYIRVDGKCMSLGMHETAEEASKVYEEAAKKYFGKFYAAGD